MGLAGKFISMLFLIAAGFALGFFMATSSGANAPIIAVKLVNASGRHITSLHLLHDDSSINVNGMDDGAIYVARFYAPKETSYRLEATFDDGSLVEAGPRYVESGLNATETIKETEILPDFKAHLPR